MGLEVMSGEASLQLGPFCARAAKARSVGRWQTQRLCAAFFPTSSWRWKATWQKVSSRIRWLTKKMVKLHLFPKDLQNEFGESFVAIWCLLPVARRWDISCWTWNLASLLWRWTAAVHYVARSPGWSWYKQPGGNPPRKVGVFLF